MFSRFDTIPAVTDSQPPSQPPAQPDSHVAVANTRYAYRCIAPKKERAVQRVAAHAATRVQRVLITLDNMGSARHLVNGGGLTYHK